MNLTTRIALTGMALAGGIGPAPAQAQHPDLSGHWTFDAAQSDDPRNRTQLGDTTGGGERGGGGRRGGMGGGRGGFGGGRGYRGGGGGGGGGMSDEQRARMRETMQLAFQAPATLTIAQSDSTMAFTADTGAAVTLYGDGRKLKQTVGSGAGDIEVDLKARWQGNDFVVERKVSGGGKVTEDYLRSRDGKQLFVIVSLDNGRGRSIEFRRVYDAVTS